MNSLPPTSDSQLAAIDAADRADALTPPSHTAPTHYSVLTAKPPGVRQEVMVAASPLVVSIAQDESPPSREYIKALDELSSINDQAKRLNELTEACQHSAVRAEYNRLNDIGPERLIAGDPAALDLLESEQAIGTRFQAERDAIDEALRRLGIASIAPPVLVAEGTDTALAKLARRLEDRDAADCRAFGIDPEWSITTKLVQAVRFQFGRKTHDLKRFSTMHPGSACTVFAKSMFRGFLDLGSWR